MTPALGAKESRSCPIGHDNPGDFLLHDGCSLKMKALFQKIGGFGRVSRSHFEIFNEIVRFPWFGFAKTIRLCMMPRHPAREAS
jgi:hypothetical protein